MKEKKVLCLCQGNSCRSPMIMAILQDLYDKAGIKVNVESAGVHPEWANNGTITDKSEVALEKLFGLKVENHVCRFAGDLDLSKYDLFLTTGDDVITGFINLGAPTDKMILRVGDQAGIPNPYLKDQAAYDKCALAIKEWVEAYSNFFKTL